MHIHLCPTGFLKGEMSVWKNSSLPGLICRLTCTCVHVYSTSCFIARPTGKLSISFLEIGTRSSTPELTQAVNSNKQRCMWSLHLDVKNDIQLRRCTFQECRGNNPFDSTHAQTVYSRP